MAKRSRNDDDDLDQIDEASRDSFPASDPPAWVPLRVGAPATVPAHLRADPAARNVWNLAVEEAARTLERAPEQRPRDRLCADIRALKAD